MRLAPQKRLSTQTNQGGILEILNNFMDFVYRAFNRNITIEDNTPYQFVDVSFTTRSDYSGGNFVDLQLLVSPSRTVKGVIPVYVSTGTISGTIEWNQQGKNVIISNIPGLSNSTNYVVRFLVL